MRFQRLRDRAMDGPVSLSGPMLTAMLDVIQAADGEDWRDPALTAALWRLRMTTDG